MQYNKGRLLSTMDVVCSIMVTISCLYNLHISRTEMVDI